MLIPDTFNNYFSPGIAKMMLAVFEHGGLNICILEAHLCCGHLFCELGTVGRTRGYLETVMKSLTEEIRDGTPVVGIEPACVSVFREEIPFLFPRSEQAMRLRKQVLMFSEFLQLHESRFYLASVIEVLDSGYCDTAGSFGFWKDKYDVSIACGKRVLLPALPKAVADTLIIVIGFSCREQILQVAQVLQMTLRKSA